MSDITFFKVRGKKQGDHVHLTLFVGPDPDHLASAGNLVFREKEAEAFIDAFDERNIRPANAIEMQFDSEYKRSPGEARVSQYRAVKQVWRRRALEAEERVVRADQESLRIRRILAHDGAPRASDPETLAGLVRLAIDRPYSSGPLTDWLMEGGLPHTTRVREHDRVVVPAGQDYAIGRSVEFFLPGKPRGGQIIIHLFNRQHHGVFAACGYDTMQHRTTANLASVTCHHCRTSPYFQLADNQEDDY